jgi:hypothetical protein
MREKNVSRYQVQGCAWKAGSVVEYTTGASLRDTCHVDVRTERNPHERKSLGLREKLCRLYHISGDKLARGYICFQYGRTRPLMEKGMFVAMPM